MDAERITSFGQLSMLDAQGLAAFLGSKRDDRVDLWNEWREVTKRPPLDLTGIRLQYVELRGIDLRWTCLRGADLFECDLQEAQLYEANLTEAMLDGADLDRAVLRKACLDGAVLDGASLRLADLYEATLRGANIDEADLRGARLVRADLSGTDLRWANLAHANLRWAKLTDVALSTAANLTDLQLFETSFHGVLSLRHHQFFSENHDARGPRRVWLRVINRLEESTIWEEQQGRFSEARDVFAALKGYFEDAGDYRGANWAYIREKTMQKMQSVPKPFRWLYPRWKDHDDYHYRPDPVEWLLLEFSEKAANYGESLIRPTFWLIALIFIFAGVYSAGGMLTAMPGCDLIERNLIPGGDLCVPTYNYLEALQFSLAAMSTIEIGNVQPYVAHVGVLTSLQALIGIMLTGLLGFVLGNKLRNS